MDAVMIKSTYPVAETRPVLVTEVTRMKGDYRCVAGWDVHAERIVRPLQRDGSNWPIGADRSVFCPGNLLGCIPVTRSSTGTFPHRNEDLPLARTPSVLACLDEASTFGLLIHHTARTIREAFRGPLIEDR